MNDLRKTELKSQKSNDSKIVSIVKSLTKREFYYARRNGWALV